MNNIKQLRDKISQILVKWGMPTRQIAIDDILNVFILRDKKIKDRLIEEISCIDAEYQGEDYRKGFNETKHKAIEIINSIFIK